jgi:hypothetical protein
MEPNIWAKFSEYGLIGIIIGVLFFILWRMLVWVMDFVKENQKQQSEERAGWLCRLEKISDIANKISDSIEDHDKRADERGRFVREEHKEMITILGRINGYVDRK